MELGISKTVTRNLVIKTDKHCTYLEIVQVDALLSVGHAEEGEDEEHGEDGPDEVPDRDDAGVPAKRGQRLNSAS